MINKRTRRTNAELFLDKLVELSDNSLRPIGNKTVCKELGWDEEKYVRVRTELVRSGQILPGRGFGGSVRLKIASAPNALKLFISYCHADETLKTELLKHLEPLRRLQLIDTWHDRQIKAGEDWGKKISSNLEVADLIILIVSIDFINSNYCYDVELERALERHLAGEAVVIPLIARSCMWKTAPFANLQALPKDAKPISLWPDRDDALSAVAASIKDTVEAILDR
jgi:TIR domain